MAQFGSRHSVYREVHLVPDAGIQGLCYLFPLLGSSIVCFFSPFNLALALLFVVWTRLLPGRWTGQVLARQAVLVSSWQEGMGSGAPQPCWVPGKGVSWKRDGGCGGTWVRSIPACSWKPQRPCSGTATGLQRSKKCRNCLTEGGHRVPVRRWL